MHLLPVKSEILEILEKNSTKTETCWLYNGTINDAGYGIISFGSRDNALKYRVHRLSAYIFLGLDIDSPNLTLHKLECKNKNCWNPDHLYLGNDAQNGLDYRNSRTHCKNGHPLSVHGVLRRRYSYSKTYRLKCKECDRIIRRKSARKHNIEKRHPNHGN